MTNYRWKDWPEHCPECGADLEVFTKHPDEWVAADGDRVRCVDPDCGAVGHISCDIEESPYAVFPQE